jgi:hypothetical protein
LEGGSNLPVSRESALKAWDTRRKNNRDADPHFSEEVDKLNNLWDEASRSKSKVKNPQSQRISYNRSKKNFVRNKIFNIIDLDDSINSILTMDTSEYLFSKNYVDTDIKIFLAENNYNEFKKMVETKPEGLWLHYGDVGELYCIKQPDVIYLDFCGGLQSSRASIEPLIPLIDGAKYIGFSFCSRGDSWIEKKVKSYEAYIFSELLKMKVIDPSKYEILLSEVYKDGATMLTMFFKNSAKEEKQ